MADDMEILRQAYGRENDTRRLEKYRHWEAYAVGATKDDIDRLLKGEFISIVDKDYRLTKYKLTDKGRNLVWGSMVEREVQKIPVDDILETMSILVGFEDLKVTIARAVNARYRTNFLLEGPPACGKSVLMEAVRAVVPDAYIAFGSRTSAAGLSDVLFDKKPGVLLLDEAEKMPNDVYAVLLGLMESGEVLETKSKKSRGVKLQTMVIAACNSSAKFPQEFLSRFALHVHFPKYTREEFVEVSRSFLSRVEGCPEELAAIIGQYVFDYGLGDVRRARAVWQLMTTPTDAEVQRVIQLMLKYGVDNEQNKSRKKQITATARLI